MFLSLFSILPFISFIISYLIGSIPSGYWFAKYFFNIDVTLHGSKNIGATNVARVLGSKKYFALIFLIDFLKAFLCLYFLSPYLPYDLSVVALAKTEALAKHSVLILNAILLLIGNSYSIFLNFKGGKGVATSAGILAFLFSFKLFLFFLACWIIIMYLSERASVASLLSLYIFTLTYVFTHYHDLLYPSVFLHKLFFLVFLCLWVTMRHKQNITKLFFNGN